MVAAAGKPKLGHAANLAEQRVPEQPALKNDGALVTWDDAGYGDDSSGDDSSTADAQLASDVASVAAGGGAGSTADFPFSTAAERGADGLPSPRSLRRHDWEVAVREPRAGRSTRHFAGCPVPVLSGGTTGKPWLRRAARRSPCAAAALKPTAGGSTPVRLSGRPRTGDDTLWNMTHIETLWDMDHIETLWDMTHNEVAARSRRTESPAGPAAGIPLGCGMIFRASCGAHLSSSSS